MATVKFYLQNADANFTPATKRGAWDDTTATNEGDLGTSPSGASTSYTGTVNSTTADYDWFTGRFTSAPLASDTTFTGDISGCIGIRQSSASLNARLHVHLYVLAGSSGDTVRGTLLSDFIENTGHYLATVQADAGQAFGPEALTQVSALAGDTIVLEVGARCSADATTYTVKQWKGSTNASPDLAEDDDGASYPGWIELEYFSGAPSVIAHAYTVTATDATIAGIVHPADWVADHNIGAGTVLNGLAPIGSVSPYAGLVANIPAGWLFCNGASLLRAGSYADLYSAIGVIYGAADGTHFNLPDLRDYFVVGAKQDDSSLPKSNIRGSLEQSATIPAATMTHNGSIANHTLTHTGLAVAAHTMTHPIAIADHPSMSLTLSVGAQDTIGRSGTKAASLVVSDSAHAWTNPTAAARTHTITQPDHTVTHEVTNPNSHGDMTHAFTAPSQHTVTPVPAFLALAYMIRYC